MNSASSLKNSILNACTLVKRGKWPISIGRLMANLHQIQLVLWIFDELSKSNRLQRDCIQLNRGGGDPPSDSNTPKRGGGDPPSDGNTP
jgi:hypothetical protein